MAFSVNYGRTQAVARRRSAPTSMARTLAVAAILFALFSIYDYSSYGHGYVAMALSSAQYSFQEFMGRFRVRL
jgi:hypothetical protein